MLIGLSLGKKTTNKNGQSARDCGNLWNKFENEKVIDKIPDKLSTEILAVYHEYEGDHTQPFSYFIGCKVKEGTEIPRDLSSIFIAKGDYRRIDAKGIMPDCVAEAWKEIWRSDIPRAFKTDFEVYDERSKDWSNAEVEIFLSIKPSVKE